ncbi:MAG: preprotein translocase subunit YajC [Planctomycetota bacterium]|nr:MAG: preprotein translocase subunit YajC [Planctomycetota bacterium]
MPTWLLLIQETANPAAAPTTGATGPTGAVGQAPAPTPMWVSLAPFVILIVLFYFMMLRPEKKARQKREQLLRNVQKGQRVVLTSGLHGTVASLSDDTVTLQVDEGVRLKFARAAIQQVLDATEEVAAKSDEKK